MTHLQLRCHGDLAGLVRVRRGVEAASDDTVVVPVAIDGARSVKDAVESVGIPHTEVGLVVVDGRSAGWDRRVVGGERVAIHPQDARLPGLVSRVRPPPLPRPPTFVADVHLGTLSRRLRLLGLDTWYANDADDAELARIAIGQGRVLLTCDRQLLMRAAIIHGALVRSRDPRAQLDEVVER